MNMELRVPPQPGKIPAPLHSLLTQVKPVVPVDLHPEAVHPGVPLGVRVPQHLALHVHDLLALVFGHVGSGSGSVRAGKIRLACWS